jgi:inosine-uridine nucleoside N-ribohydrolase
MPIHFLLDTDPGIDDAMAILFALASPDLELLGVTTVFGNVAVERTAQNALHILAVGGRPDIPVVAGAAQPLVRPPFPISGFHGSDGLGNLHLPPPDRSVAAHAGHAAGFIADMVLARPGEITLIAVGPLTNLALALQREPRLSSAVRQVILMGGAVLCPGNITPVAEANIYHDPEAARLVFGAGWPVTLVGLDVTMQTCQTADDLEALGRVGTPAASFIARILPCYLESYQTRHGLSVVPTHDPSAIAFALDPSLFTVRRVPLYVETEGRCTGQTVADPRRLWGPLPEVDVCTAVDAPRLLARFHASLGLHPAPR